MIKYTPAPDIKNVAEEIVYTMNWDHVFLDSIGFVRSHGSMARRTIARCHALGKAMQVGMGRIKGFYLIEVISENFDKLPSQEKIKVVIHELMHIPKSFGGGFIHHDKVHDRSVEKVYQNFIELKREKESKWF